MWMRIRRRKQSTKPNTSVNRSRMGRAQAFTMLHDIIDSGSENTPSAETWHLVEEQAGPESQQRPGQRHDVGHDNAAQHRALINMTTEVAAEEVASSGRSVPCMHTQCPRCTCLLVQNYASAHAYIFFFTPFVTRSCIQDFYWWHVRVSIWMSPTGQHQKVNQLVCQGSCSHPAINILDTGDPR